MDSQTPVLHPWTDGETEAGWCHPAAELWSWDSDTAGWSRLRTPRRQGWAVKVNDAEIIQSYFSLDPRVGACKRITTAATERPDGDDANYVFSTPGGGQRRTGRRGRAGVDGPA